MKGLNYETVIEVSGTVKPRAEGQENLVRYVTVIEVSNCETSGRGAGKSGKI